MHFIGLDIGTSTISGIVLDYENKTVETISRPNISNIHCDNNWEKIQDVEKIFDIVVEILELILSKYNDIKGIGITGQMHGILYIDNTCRPVSNLITWQDKRGNLIYNGNISYASYLSKISGYSLSTGFGLVTHFYNKVNNLIPGNAAKICTIMDYVALKLAEINCPFIDPSNAASLGFFDVKKLSFDNKALTKVGIDPQILPKVIHDIKALGYFKGEIPIFPAIGDNQASFLGSINDPTKSILINIGTSGQISFFSEKYIKINNFDTRPFPCEGYILVGASLCGGSSINLLKDLFRNIVEYFSDSKFNDDDFFKMANSIDLLSFNNKLHVKTQFDGTRQDPEKRGSITNISFNNFTPKDIIVGFFIGIANELYEFYKRLPKSISDKKTILIGSGNSIRMNSLLCQSFETTFKSKLKIPRHKEEAAFGACLLAIIGSNGHDVRVVRSFIELEDYK